MKKSGKDAALAIYLLSLLSGCPITAGTFEKARQKRLLRFSSPYSGVAFPDGVELNETGKYMAESAMAESIPQGRTDEQLKKLANSLRELFPTGKKEGYAYTWRDSESCIVDRLKKFFLKYGDNHTDEEIIDATKRYVASFNGNYMYMQLLKYFIWKNKVTGEEVVRGRIVGEVERQSQLAAWLEDTEEKSNSHDWGVELR